MRKEEEQAKVLRFCAHSGAITCISAWLAVKLPAVAEGQPRSKGQVKVKGELRALLGTRMQEKAREIRVRICAYGSLRDIRALKAAGSSS